MGVFGIFHQQECPKEFEWKYWQICNFGGIRVPYESWDWLCSNWDTNTAAKRPCGGSVKPAMGEMCAGKMDDCKGITRQTKQCTPAAAGTVSERSRNPRTLVGRCGYRLWQV